MLLGPDHKLFDMSGHANSAVAVAISACISLNSDANSGVGEMH
jgi:hypothetical protein